MAGGRNAVSSYLSGVEATGDGGQTFAALAGLPPPGVAAACLAIIDEDRVFTCGGVPLEAQAHILSVAANSWTRLAYYRVTIQFGKWIGLTFLYPAWRGLAQKPGNCQNQSTHLFTNLNGHPVLAIRFLGCPNDLDHV